MYNHVGIDFKRISPAQKSPTCSSRMLRWFPREPLVMILEDESPTTPAGCTRLGTLKEPDSEGILEGKAAGLVWTSLASKP